MNVLVKYTDRNQVERIELMPVTALWMTSKLKANRKHVIVMGNKIGELVNHIKSDGPMARVVAKGQPRSSAFYVEKSSLCIAEQ